MEPRPIKSAPDFTAAVLVMGGVNLLWILGVIRAHFGMGAVVVLAIVLDRLIARHRRRG